MKSYKIVTDTACDIPLSHLKENNVEGVSFSVSFDSENYHRDLTEITIDEFYEKLKDKAIFPKTSQPIIQDYFDVFEPIAKNGEDILCICLSSKLSGSYQSAINAKNMIEEEYPECNVKVIDSLCVTGSQSMLVLQAIEIKKAMLSLEEAVEKLDEVKTSAKIFFTVDSLEHLQKGGRVGKAAALAGSILNIKPIVGIVDGELSAVGKVRGQKKSIQYILNKLETEIGDSKNEYIVNSLYGSTEFIGIGTELSQALKDNQYNISPIPLSQVGVIIGSHTGPTAVGVCMIKKVNI